MHSLRPVVACERSVAVTAISDDVIVLSSYSVGSPYRTQWVVPLERLQSGEPLHLGSVTRHDTTATRQDSTATLHDSTATRHDAMGLAYDESVTYRFDASVPLAALTVAACFAPDGRHLYYVDAFPSGLITFNCIYAETNDFSRDVKRSNTCNMRTSTCRTPLALRYAAASGGPDELVMLAHDQHELRHAVYWFKLSADALAMSYRTGVTIAGCYVGHPYDTAAAAYGYRYALQPRADEGTILVYRRKSNLSRACDLTVHDRLVYNDTMWNWPNGSPERFLFGGKSPLAEQKSFFIQDLGTKRRLQIPLTNSLDDWQRTLTTQVRVSHGGIIAFAIDGRIYQGSEKACSSLAEMAAAVCWSLLKRDAAVQLIARNAFTVPTFLRQLYLLGLATTTTSDAETATEQ